MKTYYRLLIIFTVLCLSFSSIAAYAVGTLSGTIRDATGNPLNNVYVYANDPVTYYTGYAYSNSSGYYEMTNTQAGSYYVRASIVGYMGQYYGGKTYIDDNPPLVDVTDGGTTSGVDITLTDGDASISGNITDLLSNPLDNVYVYANFSGSPNVWWSTYTQTDSSGNYKITGLPARPATVNIYYYGYVAVYYDDKLFSSDADIT